MIYSAVARFGGCEAARRTCDVDAELSYQRALKVSDMARDAGVPFTAELFSRAKVTELGWSGDYRRQLVEIDI